MNLILTFQNYNILQVFLLEKKKSSKLKTILIVKFILNNLYMLTIIF